GKLPAGTYCDGTRVQETTSWVVARCTEEMSAMGFNAIHLDSMAWSIGLGLIFILSFRRAAKKAHAGVPSGLLNFVEMIIEFIDKTVKDGFQHKNARSEERRVGRECKSSRTTIQLKSNKKRSSFTTNFCD